MLRAEYMVDKLQFWLWLIEPSLFCCIAVMMVRRKLVGKYRFFFRFVIFQIFHFMLNFIAYQISYKTYFVTYWLLEPVDGLFALGVVHEIYARAFQQFTVLKKFSRSSFRWVLTVMVALAVITAGLHHGTRSDRLVTGLLVFDRSVEVVIIGLILFIFGIKRTAGIHWRGLDRAIPVGMGVIAATYAAGLTLLANSNASKSGVIGMSLTICYDLGMLVWLGGLLKGEKPEQASDLPEHGLLERWNSALQEVRRR
jgi:hypothetical protein